MLHAVHILGSPVFKRKGHWVFWGFFPDFISNMNGNDLSLQHRSTKIHDFGTSTWPFDPKMAILAKNLNFATSPSEACDLVGTAVYDGPPQLE